MKNRQGKWKQPWMLPGLLLCAMLLSACATQTGQKQAGQSGDRSDISLTGPGVSSGNYEAVIPAGTYDSADTAAVVRQDLKEGTITLFHLALNRTYTLTTRMAVSVTDAYGEPISFSQIRPGQVVDITFLKSKKRLNTLQISPKAWEILRTNRYEINWEKTSLEADGQTYELTPKPLLLEGGDILSSTGILPTDLVSIRGIGPRVYSILVEEGHGYLRLKGYDKFLGGWIEVGQDHIQRISENMKLTLPEGTYPVTISHKGGGGSREVVIRRNEETLLDINDMEIPDPEKGKITFLLKPSFAKVYIDGKETNTAKAVELEYGTYQIAVKAEGYITSSSYLKVGQTAASLEIELTRKTDSDLEESSVNISGQDPETINSTEKNGQTNEGGQGNEKGQSGN